ncbi:MAG: plasmid recombination protein [Clostridia bacterium]|nr:plasmid recombination protein [Clostridia bacterium]
MIIAKTNYSVARVKAYTADGVGKIERHNERKNESYANMNVVLERTPMNVHFKDPGDETYNETLKKKLGEGSVSTRGLKENAKLFDEMVVDINTQYFEEHGGYDYAVRFYEEAYRFAVKEYGEKNIVSAVMHADELNKAMTEHYGYPVYHYHMHITAIPVVEKKVLWTKRCKDASLVGTVKETIMQISHSKKWKSVPKYDERGYPVTQPNGKPELIPSYSLLQDRFFEHMRDAGFEDFVRGERGSTAEHLSSLDYQIKKDTERLCEIQKKVREETVKYDAVHPEHKTFTEIDDMGKKGITGKYTVAKEDYDILTELAKEGISSRGKIRDLKAENGRLRSRIFDLESQIERLQGYIKRLEDFCRPYLEAVKCFPEKVKVFFDNLLKTKDKEQEPEQVPKPKRKKKEVNER